MRGELQSKLEAHFRELIGRGCDRGLQAAVFFNGELVADVAAGVAEPDGPGEMTAETLVPVFSATKGVAGTLVHIAAAKGLIDYDTPLAAWWPEFGCRGKDAISMRMILSHTAGIPQMPPVAAESELLDWEGMCGKICRLEPLWKPGTECHYHAITFSWLAFEPLRRITGKGFNELVAEWIMPHLPEGGRCFCGMTGAEADTLPIAHIEGNPVPPPPPEAVATPDPIGELAIPPSVRPLEQWVNRSAVRRACLPASTGIMNARFLAGMYSALAAGKLIAPELLAYVAAPIHQSGVPPEARRYFSLAYINSYRDEPGRGIGHGGYGGSNAFCDRKTGLAVALLKNRMNSSDAFGDTLRIIDGVNGLGVIR